jgi:hypothetical protein
METDSQGAPAYLIRKNREQSQKKKKKTENARILGSAKSRKLLVTNQLYVAVSRHMQTLGLQDR